ncbi:MAG: hypothetical protein ABFQ53_02570 [Patescibacteria group bacterium]
MKKGPKNLGYLKEKFPRLWAEHPESFHLFFDSSTREMNELGHNVYDAIKKERRERINYKLS